jgi:putative ABC transport system substrate-binding protein
MKRLIYLLALAVSCLPLGIAQAQTQRAAIVSFYGRSDSIFDGLLDGMRELGYTEGKNIVYENYEAEGNMEMLGKLIQQAVNSKPHIIITSTTTSTMRIAKATEGSSIPVVFLAAGDPLRFVKSWQSSGNNLTGIADASFELVGKRMEHLREADPRIKRIIQINNRRGTNYKKIQEMARDAAKKLRLELVEIDIEADTATEVKDQLHLITRKQGDALFIPSDATVGNAVPIIAEHAIKQKLPTTGPKFTNVKEGLLLALSQDNEALGRQGAGLVAKVLKGARPTDLPIEFPLKLLLGVNAKTARAINLPLPRDLRQRADEVVN